MVYRDMDVEKAFQMKRQDAPNPLILQAPSARSTLTLTPAATGAAKIVETLTAKSAHKSRINLTPFVYPQEATEPNEMSQPSVGMQ